VKQQYTGPYSFDLAARTITLAGIEIPQERLALIVNATVGFVYHNIEHEPTAQVTISSGITTIVFPRYKDCETHRDTDALSIFYDDGVDLGQLIKDESDETQTLLQNEFNETQTAITDFRTEVKAESDETQTLLQNEFNETQTAITDFRTEVKAESDETQTLLQNEFNETQTAITDFRTEVKAESDETQTLLQNEFNETQTAITDFRTEVKAESDETQTLVQNEFNETQTAIVNFRTEVKVEADEAQVLLTGLQTTLSDFKTEAKSESDATQTLLNLKLSGLINGFLGLDALAKYSSENGYDIAFIPATYDGVNRNTGYSPSRIVFSQGGVTRMTIFLHYDNEGHLTLVTSQYWTPALLNTRAIWLDASDTASIESSGNYVTKWKSQLDSVWDARPFDPTTASDSRPRTGVSTINGLNVVTFDAIDDDVFTYKNDTRRALADVDQGVAYSKESAFIVARRNAVSTSRWISPGNMGNRLFSLFVDSNGQNRMILDVGANRVHHYWPNAFPAVGLWGYSFDSAAPISQLYLNGDLKMSDATPFTPLAGRQDGFGGVAGGPGSGDDVGEILVLRDVPDTPTRQKIEGYMAHKWDLTGALPADHPYKLWPPGV
jgi:uncharacterized protein YbaA (DUF1428 family)